MLMEKVNVKEEPKIKEGKVSFWSGKMPFLKSQLAKLKQSEPPDLSYTTRQYWRQLDVQEAIANLPQVSHPQELEMSADKGVKPVVSSPEIVANVEEEIALKVVGDFVLEQVAVEPVATVLEPAVSDVVGANQTEVVGSGSDPSAISGAGNIFKATKDVEQKSRNKKATEVRVQFDDGIAFIPQPKNLWEIDVGVAAKNTLNSVLNFVFKKSKKETKKPKKPKSEFVATGESLHGFPGMRMLLPAPSKLNVAAHQAYLDQIEEQKERNRKREAEMYEAIKVHLEQTPEKKVEARERALEQVMLEIKAHNESPVDSDAVRRGISTNKNEGELAGIDLVELKEAYPTMPSNILNLLLYYRNPNYFNNLTGSNDRFLENKIRYENLFATYTKYHNQDICDSKRQIVRYGVNSLVARILEAASSGLELDDTGRILLDKRSRVTIAEVGKPMWDMIFNTFTTIGIHREEITAIFHFILEQPIESRKKILRGLGILQK